MIRINNLEESEKLFQSRALEKTYPKDSIPAIRKAITNNLGILNDEYGCDGNGGYLAIMEKSKSSKEGRGEYQDELRRFHLEDEECEFSDLLYDDDEGQVRLQLFVMTEYHLLILSMTEKGGAKGACIIKN